MTQGVCYVAWGRCVPEAVQSAKTCKYATCLFTDLESPVPDGVFGHVIRTDFADFSHLHYFYRKLIAMQQTPFDVTMFADADTQFVGDVSLGFRKAKQFGFAVVYSPGGVFHWNMAARDYNEYQHVNGGALWFRDRPIEWVNAVLEIGTTITNNDEPSWMLAWEQLGINPVILPPTFNHVAVCKLHDRPIRLWHSRDPVSYTRLIGSPATS